MTSRSLIGRPASAFLAAALALAGCGTVTESGTTELPVAYGVVPAPPLPVAVPQVTFDPSASIADHDGSVVVTAADGRVVFEDVAGPELAVAVAGEWRLRAVSTDGRLAALFEQPNPATSRITVVDPTGADATRTYELPGLVEPEAFSTDGSILYVIDHEVSRAEGGYRVRPLDLETGRLETILGPTKVPLLDDMNGRGRRQMWSPDGLRLYTLYIRQTHHHHADGKDHAHGEAGTDAFVHVLDLHEEWAFCLDLPKAFGGGDLATTALAVSPDGDTLAIADVSAGQLVFASTVDLEVTHALPLPEVPIDGELQLGLTDDHVALGSGTLVHWFDRDTMAPAAEEPTRLEHELAGFTSDTSSILAWPDHATGATPRTLRP